MNCAVHLYEFMTQKGVEKAEKKIGVITAGLGLGASRMSGSDKQTYYKLGTSPDVADSAEDFAKSITAAGCVHHDLAWPKESGRCGSFITWSRPACRFRTTPREVTSGTRPITIRTSGQPLPGRRPANS